MKKTLLALLTLLILAHAPWRLMALVSETLVLSPTQLRFSQANDKYWDAIDLEVRLIGLGYEVGYHRGLELQGQAAYGLTSVGAHTVSVDADLHWNARYAVLAHEAGHILEPIWCSTRQGEAFAEMVSALVSHDGLREHARYLASMKVDVLMMALTEWPAIYHAAATLEDR